MFTIITKHNDSWFIHLPYTSETHNYEVSAINIEKN